MKYKYLLLLFLASGFAHAQADMELISISSPSGTGFIAPLTTIEVELRFKNNGPETVLNSAAGTFFNISAGARTLGLFRSSRVQPCGFRAEVFKDGPNSLIQTAELSIDRPLAPGELIVCFANLTIFPEAPPVFTHRFSALAAAYPDPNLENSSKVLTIRTRAIPPAVTSVPMSIFSYILLGSLLLACGAFANWRQK